MDFEGCLARLAELAETHGDRMMNQVDVAVDQHLVTAGPDPSARMETLYKMVAAFIARGRSTPRREAIIEHLTRRHLELLPVDAKLQPPTLRDAIKALLNRLEPPEPQGTHLSADEVELIVSILRNYLRTSS